MKYPCAPQLWYSLSAGVLLALSGCATAPATSSTPPAVSAPSAPALGSTTTTTIVAVNTVPTATPSTTVTAAPAQNTALLPIPQNGQNYQNVHQRLVQQAHSGNIDILFLGDSITDYWTGVSNPNGARGKAAWDANFAPLNAANFGYSADRTQHVLWRLRNGEGEGFQPKVIVLMIGTNNTGNERTMPRPRNTVPETIEGVTAVVNELRTRFPRAKILLLAIFPRTDFDLNRQQIAQINPQLAQLDDDTNVFYLDIGQKFLEPDGTISREVMADGLHPTAKGYEIWAAAIKTPLNDLLRRWNAQNPPAK